MRRPALLASAVLLTAGLAGCGGSSAESYCEQITASSGALEVDPTDPDAVEEVTSTFQDLADSAPEEISAEWQQLAQAFGDVQQALEDSGLTPEELNQVSEDPAAVDPEKLQQLQEAGQQIQERFSSPEFERAGDAITAYTEENCGVEPFAGS